jgi:prepilin-type N-terminal cleavage/methylation domain-containing protein
MLNNRGFSLVEMVVVMAIFVIIIAITGEVFNKVATKALFQTRTAESNIAGVIGLELMRADIESAGYGIPWSFMNSITYLEAATAPGTTLNDNLSTYTVDETQDKVPRAVASVNNVDATVTNDSTVAFTGTDVLAVRSTSVANIVAARRWSYVESQVLPTGNPSPVPLTWQTENIAATDRVVMVNPVVNMKQVNQLVVSDAGVWTAAFNNYSTIGKPPIYNDAEKKADHYMIYGVHDSTNLRYPFNRADYFVRQPAASEEGWVRLPQRCNTAAGILFKGIVSQADGSYQQFPLLSCVMDMQVVYGLLTPGSDVVTNTDLLSTPPPTSRPLTPREIREQVKEIGVYILTHDGGRDNNYTYPNPTITVGPGDGTGRTYDFAANGVPNWQNYRWRVYQIIGRPRNIAGYTQ